MVRTNLASNFYESFFGNGNSNKEDNEFELDNDEDIIKYKIRKSIKDFATAQYLGHYSSHNSDMSIDTFEYLSNKCQSIDLYRKWK